ncbi:LysM peptidoglycan-binding domain-containing protein [Williamsia sp. CHRR-6]|uniref:LysM peptidoglycan-binding domain-containing protein n=1 Tax=Williamsia sp. CHRR-6 TaxID=2835871 RepID=UPI001BDA4E7E|nr:LysM peptidoglycan-binding domain-containing protein [Williamsia sp. CHRR-6]MBT0567914.1 LysM peptidoglycan-binding domain-containing protein [Williamsia sp. CHRR-6]
MNDTLAHPRPMTGLTGGAAASHGPELHTRPVRRPTARPAGTPRPVAGTASTRPSDTARSATSQHRSGTRCADARVRTTTISPVGWFAAIAVGFVLAALVWALAIVGSEISDAHTPAVAGTSVVHVRSGESLTALAQRVAPDEPAAAVVADLRYLNHLDNSAVVAGQPLLAPVYRR